MIISRGDYNEKIEKFEFLCQRYEELEFIFNNLKFEIKDHNYANIETGFISKTAVSKEFHHRINSIHFLIDGEATLKLDEEIHLKAGDVFLIGQNVKCDWIYTKPSKEITVIFNMYLGNLDDLFDSLTKPIVLSEQFEAVKQAEELFLQENPISALKLRNLIFEYLMKFLTYTNIDFRRHIEITQKYLSTFNYIADNLSIALSVKEIARHTNRSVGFYTKNFVKDNGITVKEYIHSKVMAEVEQKLITTDESFSQIAIDFDFCELSYFTRWFKKHKNCTPSEYRKKMRTLRKT